jgi:3-deoxy-D-manno-octulosonic-acid transferase
MQKAYNLGIKAYGLALKIAALKNTKAKKWLIGRKNWRQELQVIALSNPNALWVHAASLGEIEQGLPVIKQWHTLYPQQNIVISFFSPSGFENFKKPSFVNAVVYLPLDTPANASYFVRTLKPELALFIKYEIWVNYFKALAKSEVPLVLAPAVFRQSQVYFSAWAKPFFIPILKSISQILVQDKASLELLEKQNVQNVSLCGDTRFDRVLELVNTPFETQRFTNFINEQFCIVAGSTWPEEEKLLLSLLEKNTQFKLILAPHLVSEANIKRIHNGFSSFGVDLYSQTSWDTKHRVLIINTIGDLSKIYRVGSLAFVGGGFGDGVHSTIEPLCYKIPVCFGPKHQKFIEPTEMIKAKIGFEINTIKDLFSVFEKVQRTDEKLKTNNRIENFLADKIGATDKIIAIMKRLKQVN